MLFWLKRLWALPLTLFALPLLLVVGWRGRYALRDGVIELHGNACNWLLSHLNFSAMAVGHVIFACDDACLARSRAHELEHVRQGECWGPLFPLAYSGAGLWQLLRGKSFYFDNPFERAAREASERAKQVAACELPARGEEAAR